MATYQYQVITAAGKEKNRMKRHKRYAVLCCIFFVLCMYTGFKHE